MAAIARASLVVGFAAWSADAIQQHGPRLALRAVTSADGGYGSDACQCVGVENLNANTTVSIDGADVADIYPASLGSSCQAWDEGKYPGSCDTASPEDWCSQPWCYVDVEKCVVDSGPFESAYLPNGGYHGGSLYYSYVTCDGTNTYDSLKKKKAPAAARKKNKAAPGGYGLAECQCVAIEGIDGIVPVTIDGKEVPGLYPAEIGSSCTPWDEGKYPASCDTSSPEDWCSQAWCYVDSENCVVSDGPYESDYLASATFHGKTLFYSYVTCNATNTYDAEAAKAH